MKHTKQLAQAIKEMAFSGRLSDESSTAIDEILADTELDEIEQVMMERAASFVSDDDDDDDDDEKAEPKAQPKKQAGKVRPR